MPSQFPRSPKILKGALVEFSERFLGPIPNIIIFQYNPESLIRSLAVWEPDEEDEQKPKKKGKSKALNQPGDPTETFDLNIELDAADALEDPGSHPVAVVSGVADRLAAIEMLLYPQDDESLLGGLLGSVSVSVSVGADGVSASGSAGAETKPAERKTSPVVLFVWGPGRIVPVRVTNLTVDEQAFNPLLYPIRAKATLGLQVLTDQDFLNAKSLPEKIAGKAYTFTKKQKQVLAAANIANTVESILGLLPI